MIRVVTRDPGRWGYRQYVCAVPVRESDSEDAPTWTWRECGEDVRVEWSLSHDITDPGVEVPTADASGWAESASWRVRCAAGHVLATSGADDDTPEPFSVDALAPLRALGDRLIGETS